MLEITDRCNLSCDFCFNRLYVQQRGARPELSTPQVAQLLERLAGAGVTVVRFTGGEPLLRDDLCELMSHARAVGLQPWLNTNATLLDRPLARRLAGLAQNILVPLNGADAGAEREATGQDGFQRKLTAVRMLLEYGAPRVRLGTVATTRNIAALPRLHELVSSLSVHEWELFRVIPLGHGHRPVGAADMARLGQGLEEIHRQGGVRPLIANAVPFCAWEPRRMARICLGARADDGHSRFVVDTVGRARPMYYLDVDLGNALEQGIHEIWHHPFMRRARAGGLAPVVCRGCPHLPRCKGGSRLAARLYTGSLSGVDPLARPWVLHAAGGS
jgi:AdoMet-dependent heme synthase